MRPAWAQHSPTMSLFYRCVLLIAWCVFKLFYRHKVYGWEHFYSKAAVIVANHTSFYDPPLVAVSWPEEVHFLAREGLFKNRLFSCIIRGLNAHPVSGDASDIGVFKSIGKLLAEGKKIVLFPEGQRSYTNELGLLKSGVALLVSRSHSAIIPAYIHGAFTAWDRTRRFPKLWGKTACVFGSPIRWAEFAHLDKKQAQQALLNRLARSMQELRHWYLQGAKGSPP